MKVGDDILVKAKVVASANFQEGRELMIEVAGLPSGEEPSSKNGRLRFWINLENEQVVLVKKKK
jgi:hypothetical protein